MSFEDRVLSYDSWSIVSNCSMVNRQIFTDEPTQGAIVEIFEKHETGALITMMLIIIGSAFRIYLVVKKKEETSLKWVAFGIYCLAFAAVTFTGFMGGTMVYNFMMAL